MESQDPELELSLSQLPDQPLQLSQPSPSRQRYRDEAGPSERRVRARYDQLWHGNLQEDAQALVILLQVGSVEPGGREVTFQGFFEGPNSSQLRGISPLVAGSRGHTRYLHGPVHPLSRDQRAAYVAATVQRILEFLRM